MLLNPLVLLAILTSVNGSPLLKRSENTTTSTNSTSSSSSTISPGYLELGLESGPNFKVLELELGSNNQTVFLKLDSKTSDFWVNSDINEFCSAYSELEEAESDESSNSTEWIEFNNDLKSDYDNAIDEFQIENDAKFKSLISKSASSYASRSTGNFNVKSYFDNRNSAYKSLVSQQIASVTKKIDQFLSTATIDVQLSSIGNQITSEAENFATQVTSQAGAFATAVTSEFDNVATKVVDGWDSLTSDLANLKKRENAKEGWEKFTEGAEEFFDGDLKKRENAKEGWEKFTEGAEEFFDGDLKKRENAKEGWDKFAEGAEEFFDGDLKKREVMVMTVNGVVTTMDMDMGDATTTTSTSTLLVSSTAYGFYPGESVLGSSFTLSDDASVSAVGPAASSVVTSVAPVYPSSVAPVYPSSVAPVYPSSIAPVYSSSVAPVYSSSVALVYSSSVAPVYSSSVAPVYSSSAVSSAIPSVAPVYSSSAVSSAIPSVAPVYSSSAVSSAIPSASATLDYAEIIEEYIYDSSRDCSLYGVFNDSASTSFKTSDDIFISLGGYDFGLLGNDSVTLGNVTVNTTFGVADSSISNVGVIGIGQSNENSTFQSLPYILAENDYISKALYSLYISSNESSIIFGAIDFSRIEGNISIFPLLNTTESIALSLSSVNVTVLNETSYEVSANETQAIIDTTSNNVLLPNETFYSLVDSLNTTFNVTYDDDYERYTLLVVDEEYTPEDVFVTFDFGGEAFDVALSNFVVAITPNETFYYNESSALTEYAYNRSFYFDVSNNSDNTSYILSILPSETDEVILGLDFLVDTIVAIVDLDSQEIGLAYNSGLPSNETFIYPIDDEIPISLDDF